MDAAMNATKITSVLLTTTSVMNFSPFEHPYLNTPIGKRQFIFDLHAEGLQRIAPRLSFKLCWR